MSALKFALLIVGAIPLATACATGPRPAETTSRRAYLMGTSLDVDVSATTRADSVLATEAALRAIRETETRLSTWKSESELSSMNRSPIGVAKTVSPELHEDLRVAFDWSHRTGGAFQPGLGALIELLGTRKGPAKTLSANVLRRAIVASDLRHFVLSEGRVTRLHADFRIEEGGFGKGVALDRALEAARRTRGTTAVTLNFGGQTLSTEARSVEIADPVNRDSSALAVAFSSGSVSTSGNGARGAHIIDPRTGRPVPGRGSVTVWAPDATTADCLSTAFFVMGKREALAWLKKNPVAEAVFLEPDENGLEAVATCGLENALIRKNPEVKWSPSCET